MKLTNYLSLTIFYVICLNTGFTAEDAEKGDDIKLITFTSSDWTVPQEVTITGAESEDTYEVVLDELPSSDVVINLDSELVTVNMNESTSIEHEIDVNDTDSISSGSPFNFTPYICLAIGVFIFVRGRWLFGGTMVAGSALIIGLEITVRLCVQNILQDTSVAGMISYVRLFYWSQVLNQMGIVMIGLACLIAVMKKTGVTGNSGISKP